MALYNRDTSNYLYVTSCGIPISITADDVSSCSRRSWWRHQMQTFSALLALCAGNSPVTVESPHKGHAVTRSFNVSFDLRLNKRFGKQSWGWWFETPSHPLWRYRNERFKTFEWITIEVTGNMLFVILPNPMTAVGLSPPGNEVFLPWFIQPKFSSTSAFEHGDLLLLKFAL